MRLNQFTKPVLLPSCLLALCSLASVRVQAQVTMYTDRPTFEANASGLTVIDFNDQLTPPDTVFNYAGNTVTLSGVTFTANTVLFAINPAYSPSYGLGDGTVLTFQGGAPRILTIALPANISALGFEFGGISAAPFTFTLSTGDTYTLQGNAVSTPPPAFVGFTSAVNLTSLTISSSATLGSQIDRFTFGTASSPVPEPGSVALLAGMGAVGAGFLRHRKQSAHKAA